MSRLRANKPWLWLPVVVGLLFAAGGCDRFGWLSFNIYIPLGLSEDETGLIDLVGDSSAYVPTNGTETEPPLPVQIGDQTGGEIVDGQ